MLRKTKFIVLTMIIVLIIGVIGLCYNNSEIDIARYKTIEVFKESIKHKDLTLFLTLINNKGIVLIRNFVSGGNGTRGTNTRMLVDSSKITKDLTIKFDNREEGFSLKNMFPKSIGLEIKNYHYYQTNGFSVHFKDDGISRGVPLTSEVIDKCLKIRLTKYKDDESPTIIILSDSEFVLTESSTDLDLPIGTWAFFEKFDGKYYLRGLIDFK